MSFFTDSPMVRLRCCNCDVEFAVTETLHASRKSDGKDFFCPNGHPQVFKKTTEAILRERLDATERLLQATRRVRDENLDRALKAERAASRAKAQAKRAKVAGGAA